MSGTIERTLAALVILASFGVLGGLMALRPHWANERRMKLRGQIEGPDWYIRMLGINFVGLSIMLASALIFVGK